MIKTIKIEKQLRLDELIKFVWDNELYPSRFDSTQGRYRLQFSHDGSVNSTIGADGIFGGSIGRRSTLFEIEIEEEITEDTVFDSLIEIVADGGYIDHGCNISISDIEGQHSIRFYALINGKLELIWEREEE